jgi:hypothetical protein
MAGIQGGAIALTQWAGSMDPNAAKTFVLGAEFGTTTAVLNANALVNIGIANASRAVAAAVPKAPAAFLGAVDLTLLYGVVQERRAALAGTCHP